MTDVIDEHIAGLEAEIERLENVVDKLTAENAELKSDLYSSCVIRAALTVTNNELKAELADWEADAENLVSNCLLPGIEGVWCRYCGFIPSDEIADFETKCKKLVHKPNCPIELHRKLIRKYEVRE